MKHDISVMLLAAGVGRRLEQAEPAPKILLDMGGESLIARHLRNLMRVGVTHVVIVTGYQADMLEAAIRAIDVPLSIRFVRNPRFREGSVVSFHTGCTALEPGRGLILMDGDVLYDLRMLEHLLEGTGENVLLADRNIEPGDEPVKICFDADDRIVDFRKRPEHDHVWHGESVGFFRFSPATTADLAAHAAAYAADERAALEYEEVIRDLILAAPDRFRAADVSALPWTEIDFPEDVVRARTEILPLLED